MRTLIDFDGHVRQSGEILEPVLVGRWRLRRIGNDRHDHRSVAGAYLPEMQIGQPVAADLDALADALGQCRIRHRVEQDATGGTDQAERPGQDHEHTDQADQRVREVRPNAQASDRPAVANTEVSASASTCT